MSSLCHGRVPLRRCTTPDDVCFYFFSGTTCSKGEGKAGEEVAEAEGEGGKERYFVLCICLYPFFCLCLYPCLCLYQCDSPVVVAKSSRKAEPEKKNDKKKPQLQRNNTHTKYTIMTGNVRTSLSLSLCCVLLLLLCGVYACRVYCVRASCPFLCSCITARLQLARLKGPCFSVPLGQLMYTSYTQFELPLIFVKTANYLQGTDAEQTTDPCISCSSPPRRPSGTGRHIPHLGFAGRDQCLEGSIRQRYFACSCSVP